MKRTLLIRVEVDVEKHDMYAALSRGAQQAMFAASQEFDKPKTHSGEGFEDNTHNVYPRVAGKLKYEWILSK